MPRQNRAHLPFDYSLAESNSRCECANFRIAHYFFIFLLNSFSVWICQRLLAFCATCTLALIAPFTTLYMYTQGHTDVQSGLILSIVMVVQVFFSSFGRILIDTA